MIFEVDVTRCEKCDKRKSACACFSEAEFEGELGQTLLTEIAHALDTLEEKRLTSGDYFIRDECSSTAFITCTVGSLMIIENKDIAVEYLRFKFAPFQALFDLYSDQQKKLLQFVARKNDSIDGSDETRWTRMRDWVEGLLLGNTNHEAEDCHAR